MPVADMRVELGDVAIDLWPFALAVFVVLLVILWLRKRNLSYLVCCCVFGIYLLVAAAVTFFPLQISGSYADFIREDRGAFGYFINLIPFYFGPYGTLEGSLVTLAQNVLLTVPFGFGISFVANVRAKSILWLALAVGLGIEGTQLVISLLLRYPYRFIDVNDVLMNALGVLIGYGFFRVFASVYAVATQRLGIRHRGLTAYVYEVVRRAR